MSAVTEATLRVPVISHRPWWRGKIVQVAAIVGAMVVAYELWGVGADGFVRYSWPAGLSWDSLAVHLDTFATWLSDQRNAPEPSFVFSVFNSFATFLDNLVSWLTRLLLWMTWIGTATVGTLLAWRYGGRAAGLTRSGCLCDIRRHRALGAEHADAGADVCGRGTLARRRGAARNRRRPL